MKIDEFEKPQLNEGFLDTLLGQDPRDDGSVAAGFKSAFNPGMTAKTQLAQDRLTKEFVADAIASLQNAIKSGLVVPTAAPKPTANTPKTAANTPKTTAATPVGKNAASTDPYEKLKGQIRQLQPKPNTKPLPNNLVVELNGDMEKLAKGDKESGMNAANKILKLANDGYNVSELTTTWKAKSKAGERLLTQSVYREITHMLREHGLSWDNLGLRIRLCEGVANSGVFLSRCNPIPVTTTEFKKMDQVFESIVTELFGNNQPVEGAERISSFMMDWFGQWMHGVNWGQRKPQVQSLINAIETNYPNGNWKGAIQRLAKAAYALSSAGATVPRGARNIVPAGKGPESPATSNAQGSRRVDNREKLRALVKAEPEIAKKYGITANEGSSAIPSAGK